ncbi:554_t:CDS:10, partial [Funneliformis mosseae]
FTPPRMRGAKTERNRKEYWERSKKLLNGSLITLLLPNQYAKQQTNESTSGSTSINSTQMYSPYFGVVISRNEKVLAKSPDYADININFTDLSIYPIALNEMSNSKVPTGNRFMVESTGVYLEAYYHVLKTIQTTNSSSLPFEKYLTPNFNNINDGKGKDNNISSNAIDFEVEPPLYTRAPSFEFDLSVICRNKNQNLKLNVAKTDNYDEVAKKINESCKLDETQANALISALTREIALIEGPPGTGKTVVGVEIMKVLLAKKNRKTKIGPILTICFTNHALDQFLEHLLDAKITNIVRLGSRTKSDKIKEFCLEEVCRSRARNRTESRLIALLHENLEKIEDRVNEIKSTLFKKGLKWADIRQYLMNEERTFYDAFCKANDSDLPSWVFNTEEGFTTRKKQKKRPLFERWVNGEDIEIIRRTQKAFSNQPQKNKKNKKDPSSNTYDALKVEDEIKEITSDDVETQTDYKTLQWIKDYVVPKTNRTIEELLSSYSIWQMSRVERRKLTDYWSTKIRDELIEELSNLQNSHDNQRKEMDEIYDEGRRRILLASDVIGMTTNGAAKFQALIRSIGPRIIVCEEAGEVLEAHILSALTPSTQHIILIGDPKQLRPNIATYSLRMDSTLGKNYQLDKSLFERLVEGDNAAKIGSVQLLTQRRMRKEISDLVRDTLYPKLIDGENTVKYPNIRGAQHNVYFIDHKNPEDSGGEEATIVIISLVRNYSGSGKHDSIGFLKSKNRSNVLLSRARQGMYLIGNSELMASESKDMWTPVIELLQKRKQIGSGMPIVCNRHPDYKNIIDKAEKFKEVSPDGGCYEPCRSSLICGHVCIYKCHSDNDDHIGIKCPKKCTRLYQPCGHPCPKLCFEDCGKCEFSIGDIILPGCGHVLKNAQCWQNQDKDTIKCITMVEKQLIHCEHSKVVHCFESIDNAICREKCGKLLECDHVCLMECYRCQKLSKLESKNESNEETNKITQEIHGELNKITRTNHGNCKHICNRLLFCEHICNTYCHEGKACPPCKNKCTVSCMHTSCDKECLEPCAVCAEKCLWKCEHQGKCELSCGAPCHRLPCNERCNKQLECGHVCAGVCGENCPSELFCVICAPINVRSQVPDLIMGATFSDIDWDEERMIVLSCGHVYTMETMDMHMEMREYYEGSVEKGWKSIKFLSSASLTDAKTCPACRIPIKNVKRYGRIINKCVLDTQNKKFLTKYDNQLRGITKQMILIELQINNKRNELKNNLGKIPHDDSRPREVVFKEHNFINIELPEIIPYEYFENIEKYHGFGNNCNIVWLVHVGRLLRNYRKLTIILCATKKPPHKKAFEAAVSSLYQAKLARNDAERDLISQLSNLNITEDLNTNDSNFSPGRVLQETLSQIGISVPKVDHRIYLDALFELINIQKILFHEVLFIIQEISKVSKVTNQESININEIWKKFAEWLQLSILKHLNVFKKVAESTHYGRHLLLANVEILEFDLKIIQYQLRYPSNGSSIIDKELRDNTIENCNKIVEGLSGILTSEGYNAAEETFKKGIHERLSNVLKSCNDVKSSAENLGKPLSVEETLEIHRAMKTEFKRSGHWFECPNGHPRSDGVE